VSALRLQALHGTEIARHIDALANVRITVFREWPYLYDGTQEYEAKYLDVYVRSPHSLVVLVWDGDRCVGATTAIPLAYASDDAQRPFVDGGRAIETIDYFGESVLLPDYRGRGLGVKFFELREAHAREHGLSACTFCAVVRPQDHPDRPADYVSNDAFWTRRGYRQIPAIVTMLSWPDIGCTGSTAKPMVFWMKQIAR